MSNRLILGFLILLKLALQFILINPVYELHKDEFLHLDQANHLAWGYLSVPPVTSWISWIIAQLGNSEFLVKLVPALFGVCTMVVVWKWVEDLGGKLYARVLAATGIIFSVILRLNILYQPNSLDVLCWTLILYSLFRYIRDGYNTKWIWTAALSFAIGFLNKYNVAFLLLGLLPALLLSEHRKVFLNKHFYLSFLMGILVVSPNLVWQFQNDFPVFRHLSTLTKEQLVNVSRVDFLKDQLLFFIGSLVVIFAGWLSYFAHAPFRKYRVLFTTYCIVIVLFIYFRAKGYYAIGLYPMLLSFGAVYIEKIFAAGWRRYARTIIIVINLAVFVPFVRVAFPLLTPEKIQVHLKKFKAFDLLRWEDGKEHALPQDFADMLGWKELAAKVDSAYTAVNDPAHTLVLCSNYGQAGAINYYSRNKNISAVSYNADYINWFPLEKEIRHVILVKEKYDTARWSIEAIEYGSQIKAGEITHAYARENGTVIYILKDANEPLEPLLRRQVEKGKLNPF